MADDNDFDQIVGQIRDALTIPTYGLTDFYGSDESFEIFNETNSDGESSLSPYAEETKEQLYHMNTVIGEIYLLFTPITIISTTTT